MHESTNTTRAGRTGRARPRRWVAGVAALAVLGAGAACSSDDSADTTSTTEATTSTTEAVEVLTILVSNDDGVGAPGIDTLVSALSELPDTEVIVVAPAEEQSGTGSKVTEGEVEVAPAQTASGHEATAVDGFPADSVGWALDGGIDVTPHVVITGINAGQNIGGIGDQVSGTIGAARAAGSRGVPALATSVGLHDEFDFDTAVEFVVDWVVEHRDELLAGVPAGDEPLLENLNVPSCGAGEVRGLVEVTMSSELDGAVAVQDCTSTAPAAADDITAFNSGFATLSPLSLEPAA